MAIKRTDSQAEPPPNALGSALPPIVSLGYACCQTCILFPEVYSPYAGSMNSIGKLMGFAAIVLACYLLNRNRSFKPLVYVPSLLLVAGLVGGLAAEASAGPAAPLQPAADRLFGLLVYAGSAMATIQWFEYCATLSNKFIIVVLAGGSLLSGVCSALMGCFAIPKIAYGLICLFFGVISSVLLWVVLNNEQAWLTLQRYKRVLPTRANRNDYTRIILWTLVLVFTYAMFVTEMRGHTPGVPLSLGRILTSALILACYRMLADSFDIGMTLTLMLPIVVASLASVGYSHAFTPLPVLLFNMGESAAHILVYAMILGRSSQYRTSPVFLCATVMFFDWLAHFTYGLFQDAIAQVVSLETLTFGALIVDSVVIARLVMYELNRHTTIDNLPGVRMEVPKAVSTLADSKNLTSREKTVFIHMAAGHTNAQISNELFISQGAVRSHASRIYEKLGVTSRRELDILVQSLEH